DVPAGLPLLRLLRRRSAGQQVLRERHLRLDGDAVLPPAHAGVPGRGPRQTRAQQGYRMTAPTPIAVAPNFYLPGPPADRLLIADGAGWHKPSEGERSAEPHGDAVLLFALPGHLRTSFWGMLEWGGEAGEFDAFASEVGRFLAFKQLPAPEGAVF